MTEDSDTMTTDHETMTDTTTDSTDVQERLDRLESLVEAQQETIQQQRDRIDELEGETDGEDTPLLANRRNTLKAGGLLALLFGGVGTVSADAQGQVGTSSDPLEDLYAATVNTDTLTDNGSGSVSMSAVPIDLAGNKLTDNSGGLNIEASAGNGVTVNTDGSNRALKLGVPSSDNGNTAGGNVIAGHPNNTINNSAVGTVICGGGANNGNENSVGANYATVGGGKNNTASGLRATVGGGQGNDAIGEEAIVGGGENNTASGLRATVGGGLNNGASGSVATVGGGQSNTTNGGAATVGGGFYNTASADYTTVPGGRKGKARDQGSFVWADSTDATFASDQTGTGDSPTGVDTFHVRATGGLRLVTGLDSNNDPNAGQYLSSGGSSWQTVSARAAKQSIKSVDPASVLSAVEDLEVSTWEYEENEGVRRMGPMAGEFYDAFELGDDPETIGHVDADGVALAAIQGLSEKLNEKDDRIDDLEAENEQLRERVAAIEAELGIDAVADRQGVADD